jgi:RNA polymerase sigma-54 factor
MEINPALEEGSDEPETEALPGEAEDYEDDSRTEAEKEIDISDYLDNDDTPDYKYEANNKGADDDEKVIPIAQGTSFHEQLEEQLSMRLLNEQQRKLAETLIGNLDDNGYLRRDLESIVDDLAFSQNIFTNAAEIEEVLKIVQDLDPAGIGARDLRECLLLQIVRKDNITDNTFLAKEILEDYFEEFTKKHYDKIKMSLEISDEDLKEAIDEIVHLNPKPGNSSQESSRVNQSIIPDFNVINNEGVLELSINGRNAPDLKVSRYFKEMLASYAETKSNKDAVQFIKQKIDSAKWFIDAIKQRQDTLLYTMSAIVDYQREYFLTGDETKLRPMILKDIADIVNLDISTVSRVANSKYVQTDFGTFLLKSFFSESLTKDDGEEVSTIEVKKILQESIGSEDKHNPLTDEKLMDLLKEKGYLLARRTVAKYREQLNIPVARLRKEL